MANIMIEVSPGDFFDRLTILRIKLRHSGPEQVAGVRAKLDAYELLRRTKFPPQIRLQDLEADLTRRNEELWDLENKVRTFVHPLQPAQTDSYIATTRAIFDFNEERAVIKREIDLLFSEESAEGKVYQKGP